MQKAIETDIKIAVSTPVQECICNFLDMVVLKCIVLDKIIFSIIGSKDTKIKKYPDDPAIDHLQQATEYVIMTALLLLRYGNSAEKQGLAISALLHFAKIAENNDYLEVFGRNELIDQVAEM